MIPFSKARARACDNFPPRQRARQASESFQIYSICKSGGLEGSTGPLENANKGLTFFLRFLVAFLFQNRRAVSVFRGGGVRSASISRIGLRGRMTRRDQI